MENLNDVEFGSDKSNEEAPILIAQRYLNIFRQIHIFNKDKRDHFDDELLALPTNISDFFKRMPGGRLLVEHIEDVKTERGISFVKTNRDEFSNTATDATSTPTATAGGPIVGGNLVIDESFAESLANSMALAFKQNPMQATVSGSTEVTSSGDFSKTFSLIAEEIKSSRNSLLDVLKETKNITDTVIASQVSISRILEGILSARSRDDSSVADLNNRIIASQASITKLLESIYSSDSLKGLPVAANMDIEQKLQSFKNELKNEISNSSFDVDINQKLQSLKDEIMDEISNLNFDVDINQKLQSLKNEIKDEVCKSSFDIDIEQRLQSFRDEIKEDINKSNYEANIEQKLQLFKSEVKEEISRSIEMTQRLLLEHSRDIQESLLNKQADANNNTSTNTQISDTLNEVDFTDDGTDNGLKLNNAIEDNISSNDGNKKKKKKKKKNKGINTIETIVASSVLPTTSESNEINIENVEENFITDINDVLSNNELSNLDASSELPTFDESSDNFSILDEEFDINNNEKIDAIIKNDSFKHVDDFENIDLSTPPLNIDDMSDDIFTTTTNRSL